MELEVAISNRCKHLPNLPCWLESLETSLKMSPLLVTRIDRIKKHLSMFSNFLTSNKISNQLKYLKLKSSTWSVTCSECKYRLLRFVHHTASPQIIDVIEKVTVGGFNPPPRNSWHFDPSKLIYHLERIDGDRHSHVLL